MDMNEVGSPVWVLDMTGLPLQGNEARSIFAASVLYLRQSLAGEVSFSTHEAEGSIESLGFVEIGSVGGHEFRADLGTMSGGRRSVKFFLPPPYDECPVPDHAVRFGAIPRSGYPEFDRARRPKYLN
jgi:hypothetical protein